MAPSKMIGMAAVAGGARRLATAAGRAQAVARVRGTRDLLPEDAEQRRRVVRALERAVGRYGFRPVQTPALEYTELFSRSLGDGSDIVMKEMYTFEDNSGKSVTLRPEGTAGMLRAALERDGLEGCAEQVVVRLQASSARS